MKTLNKVKNIYNDLHQRTKNIIIFCSIYIMLTFVCSAACYISAGTLMGYYTAIELGSAFLTCTNSCIGITALGALLIESVSKDCS